LPLQAGNRAVTRYVQRFSPVVQRERRAEALAWLGSLLAGSEGVDAAALARAVTRIQGWSTDRQVHVISQLRSQVDGFENTIRAQLTEVAGGALVGLLEGARSNTQLGQRLVDVFQSSSDPALGLVLVHNLPRARIMAALTGRADATTAIQRLLARNPTGSTHVRLGEARASIEALGNQIQNPTTAGARTVDSAMEARVEAILTPPSVTSARAAAAAAGGPAPTFEPSGYLADLMAAIHGTMLGHWPRAEAEELAHPMDTAAGGHVEGIATEAKRRVDAIFGPYGSAAAPALTFAAHSLNDQTATPGDPVDMTRYFVEDEGGADIGTVNDNHHSFEDSVASNAIATRAIDLYSGRSAPSTPAETAALAALGMATAERQRRLRIIDRMWPGLASGGRVFITAREGASPRATRARYWGLFKTMLHEYLHTTESSAFKTWYNALTNHHHQVTYQEGMTDLFTLYTWNSVFPDEIAANPALRRAVQGTDDLDMAAVGGVPSHYPELAEAQQLETEVGLANMRMARFQGRTDLLAAGRLPHT